MAQKGVCGVELMKIVSADVALIVKLLQRKERAAGAQPGFAASINALQTLHEEFNVADSTTINFDVERFVSFGGSLPAALAVYLFAGDQRCFDGGKVDFFAINLGLNTADEGTR